MAEDKGRKGRGSDSVAATNQISAPTISLPKGGGAIRGMGEKFAANLVTGTGSMSVPIATSPGRSGFGPRLSLSYDSGVGNGPFGLGWNLSLPSITRKTEKGLPKFQDVVESDVFILSGAEDLVPVLTQNIGGEWAPEDLSPRTVNSTIYRIQRYRPRIEGLFARIERWTNQTDPQDTFWRSISRDNITTWYGKTSESRIADPADPIRIFSWLICESYDDKGDVISYRYKEENSDQVDLSQVHERNRTQGLRKANRYLKHICYGNRTPYFPQLTENTPWPTLPPGNEWYFEVVFDYGEHDADAATPTGEIALWPCRNDPFSSYRAGFEVRTYRLCQRVLMFHHFPGETNVGSDCLVRSTDFTYSYEKNPNDVRKPIFSTLLSMAQCGYKRLGDGYLKKSLPPVEFQYTEAKIDDSISNVDVDSLENLPAGLDGRHYQWIDLDGEGLSGILTEQAEGWFYKRNLSPVNLVKQNGEDRVRAKFAPVELVATKPNTVIAAGHAQFMDLAGDGHPDLVMLDGPIPGLYEHDEGTSWAPFRPFTARLNRSLGDPNLKLVDLDGDGHADVFVTEDEAFTWHPSLSEEGFGPAQRVAKALDEEKGPALVFADGTQSIYLADLSGDGLADLVRIRNGEVCYWPNFGYGCFGAKVTMDNAPWFDNLGQFDQRRIHLADIDGSGTTDILYLHRDGVRLYYNQSGNSWSPPSTVSAFPCIDDLAAVTVVDLLGTGTACLVWSSPAPRDTRRPMRYIDLMGGKKPHLLVATVNNLGAETKVHYASSTKFYLQDKLAGRPWVTRLPFPVHVVERVETFDWISRNRFVTRSAYHQGYFDGDEREFRGFGMVEQWDTEELAALTDSGDYPNAVNIDAASYVPTVLTKTWFHTGAYLESGRISRYFEDEYYREGDESDADPGLTDQQLEAMLLPDTELPTSLKRQNGTSIPWQLTIEEVQEACRALKGSVLRREIYALDGTEEKDLPYSATEQNYTIELLQPQSGNKHAVFLTHPHESIEFHYERKLVEVGGKKIADPRVTQTMTLAVDGYSNVLQSIAIGYGRRPGLSPLFGDDKSKQEQIFLTCTDNEVTNLVDEVDAYRTPLPAQTRTYELLKVVPDSNSLDITSLFGFDELLSKVGQASDGLHDLPYEDVAGTGATANHPYRRLIEHVRTLYRRNDLTGPLPLGQLHSLAVPFESYKLAFTSGLLKQIYGNRVTDVMLVDEGRYLHSEGDTNWWIPSGRTFLSPGGADTSVQELDYTRQHFFLPHRFRDPLDNVTVVDYDVYDLLVRQTTDPVGNRASADHEYRLLQPYRMIDPNGNRAEVSFDILGLVAGTALMGKTTETKGDSLAGFDPNLTQQQRQDFLVDPFGNAALLLGQATTRIVYDLDRYVTTQQPPFAATLARETHVSDPLPPGGLKIQISVSYSDGFGREIQKKIQAEPGPVVEGGPIVNPRWVGTGWTIFNNKGKPVRQYEPFFDDTHEFEFRNQVGVSPILFYDPVERMVATLHPDHTWEKGVFDPWQQENWDVNDTVLLDPKMDDDVKSFFVRLPDADYLPTWYEQRGGGALGAQEQDAANKASAHASTPSVSHADSLGRTFLTIADNAVAGQYTTRVVIDIEGNQRELIDAKDRIVMRYDYDLLGTRLHQESLEASERWMFNDVTGKPLYTWDSRDHQFRMAYDALHRPTDIFLRIGAGVEQVIGRTIYGESLPNPEARNQRGKPTQLFDQAGVVTSEDYDFKGNLLGGTRQLLQNYKTDVDWSQSPAVESDIFTSTTTYDALNRPIFLTTPDSSVYCPTFNEANLLEKVDVNLRGEIAATPFVTNIDYNAKGQRDLIEYGNNTRTDYTFDDKTFRLMNLKTTRVTDNALLQDLKYTYDPAGNITQIQDNAQQTIYFNNQVVAPQSDYVYDAIYRLIAAAGREHIGQAARPQTTYDDTPRMNQPLPTDGQAMRNYTEQYVYDAAGNFLQMMHQAMNGSWTRGYAYNEPSLIEPTKQSNRLSSTTVGTGMSESYSYDAHGNMLRMSHISNMEWDFKDELRVVDLGGGGMAYYVYDGRGQRVRKVVEKNNGAFIEEQIYLGAFEIYRKRTNGVMDLERETLNIMDDKKRIALVETKTIDSRHLAHSTQQLIRFQYGNHLGSVSLELDDQAKIISFEEYYSYGSTSYQAVRNGVEVSPKRYRFTGMEKDEETNLAYHGARYYVVWLGRWTTADPIGIRGGINLYEYADSSPCNRIDPQGLDPPKPDPGNFVVAFGRSDVCYMESAEQNTGLRSINIQDAQTFLYSLRMGRETPSGLPFFPNSSNAETIFGDPTHPGGLSPMFSGFMTQEALEGNAASTIHFDMRGVDLTPPLREKTSPGSSPDDFHSSSEARQGIAHLASTGPGERKVDIVIHHEKGVTTIPRESNTIKGDPLPSRLADRMPNINNKPSGTGGASPAPVRAMGAVMGLAFGVLLSVLTTGTVSAEQVTEAAATGAVFGAVPEVAIATAKDHGETAIPIMAWAIAQAAPELATAGGLLVVPAAAIYGIEDNAFEYIDTANRSMVWGWKYATGEATLDDLKENGVDISMLPLSLQREIWQAIQYGE